MILSKLQIILVANGLVLLIPGVNMALVAYHSINSSFKAGAECAIGITLAISLHVIAAIFGAITLYRYYPESVEVIRLLGVGFIICIGLIILASPFYGNEGPRNIFSPSRPYFLQGFFTDLLNPVVMVFYASLFSQIIEEGNDFKYYGIYLSFIIFITLVWFVFLAFLFSIKIIKRFSEKYKVIIQILVGSILIYSGVKIIV